MKKPLIVGTVVFLLIVGWSLPCVWAEEGAGGGGGETAEEAPPPFEETGTTTGEEEATGGEETPAPEEEAPVPSGVGEKDEGMTLVEVIQAGGLIGYLIILLSVIGLGLILENFYSVRRSVLVPDDLADEIEQMFDEKDFDGALELCESEPNLMTNMIGAGLTKIQGGHESMTQAMDEALEEGATHLHQKVNYLSLIGNVAPMMGLLGTVQGMILAFQRISKGTPKAKDLAGDISLALVTTMLGLVVAIPMLAFHMFLKNRVVKIVMEASAVTNNLMDRFKTK